MDQDPFILALLSVGVAHCRAVAVEHGGLLASLFLAGLLGSATHCVGMCGPLVLAQTMARLGTRSAAEMRELDRLTGAALVPYHLGRATTYAALGAAAATLTAGMAEATNLRWLSAALLALAAIFFVGYAVRQVGSRLRWRWFAEATGNVWSQTVGRFVRPLFGRPLGWRGYILGVALGLLPCGLLYGAVAASAASGHPLSGALAMLAFALGTVPALMSVGLLGHVAGRRFRGTAARLAPALMLVNAGGLSYLAWRSIA